MITVIMPREDKTAAVTAELLLLCGVINDIAELCRQKELVVHLKIVQERLEKIATTKN